jgi:hypothetical protein
VLEVIPAAAKRPSLITAPDGAPARGQTFRRRPGYQRR